VRCSAGPALLTLLTLLLMLQMASANRRRRRRDRRRRCKCVRNRPLNPTPLLRPCCAGLPSHYATTKCLFSPDERLLLTGVAADAQGEGGALVVVDRQKRAVVRRVAMPASVVGLAWHHRLNQIFVGIGGWPAVGRLAGGCWGCVGA
jgi:hypothetical protein